MRQPRGGCGRCCSWAPSTGSCFSVPESKMRSFIFNFRAVLLALGVIAATEGVCALALRPGLVERTNVGLLDLFHNSVLFGKLGAFADSSPDIIQVGDSSGFHGVRPGVVMQDLGVPKYVNLSCCANTGYRG